MTQRLVPFAVTVCGISELSAFGACGVTHVLSILDPGYPEPSAFGAYDEHERLELRFDDVIEERVEGKVPPSSEDVDRILAFGRGVTDEPAGVGHLLVHCHMGVSRSTASLIMILAQARPDVAERDVVRAVVRIRPQAWPNLRMIEFADAKLKRDGRLVEAVRERHHAHGLAHPEFVDEIILWGRGREAFWR